MKISVVASGTRGDVQPYLALSKGLQEAGYNVRLLASENFEALITGAGVPFGSMGMGAEERIQSEEWRKAIEGGNFFTVLGKMQAEVKNAAADLAPKLPPLLEGSDLIITGMAGLGGVFSIAAHYKIPVIQAYVVPFTPTQEFSTPLVPSLPLGKLLNRFSYHVTHQLFWQSTKASDAETRRLLGMPKPPLWGPFRDLARSQPPTLYGYSAHVLPRPQDWGAQAHVTGYWFLDEGEDWQPPADLMAFLDAGDPPVYIGFGSMGSRNPEEAGRITLDALARSRQRGVIASGWGGLKPTDLPDTVHLISSLPHSWLFPRMAAVVHHGGAGTTAAGLRAGVPSIVTPFGMDQPFWGRRIADLGVGPQPIPRKRLTGERLGDAITEAVSNPSMRRLAADLGEKIRSEDGVGNAVAVVARGW
ncbi:MAG: glycosyltransferase family 1 protein [Caldilineaceae bacterium]|nr:glycosyltransferase family 1 protein [Caldilineaceae bacterium]